MRGDKDDLAGVRLCDAHKLFAKAFTAVKHRLTAGRAKSAVILTPANQELIAPLGNYIINASVLPKSNVQLA